MTDTAALEQGSPAMNPAQVTYIQQRFYGNPHWEDMAKHHPRLVAGLRKLPDETLIRHCNSMIVEMFEDTKRECGQKGRT